MNVYPLDIVSLILLITILQGLIFSIVVLSKKGSSYSNRFLVAIILVLIWYQLEFLFVREVIDWDFNLFYGSRYGSWLLLGPLIYLYSLTYTKPDFSLKWNHLAYFLPFLLCTIVIPTLLAEAVPERGRYYGMLTVMKFPKMGLSAMQTFYGLLFYAQFIVAAIFTLLSYRIAQRHAKVQENNLPDISGKWLSRITLSTAIILISSIVFFSILFFLPSYERWMDHIYVIPVSIIIYGINFGALRQSKVLDTPLLPLRSWEKYEKSSLTEQEALSILSRLENSIKNDKPYLDNELTLTTWANQLAVSPHYLSQVINERLNTSFYNLINQYRVEEAQNILKASNGDKTILEVAFASGFNNKVSFNNYFKKHTGMTPRDFLKSIS